MSEDNHVSMHEAYVPLQVSHLPSRIESFEARVFRVAEYPDGSKRVQGAYAWVEGFSGGVVWRDLPLVKVDGLLLAIKGEKAQEEIVAAERALQELRGELVTTERTPTGTIVAIRKTAKTVRLYPREQGLAARKPLGGKANEPD